MKSRTILMMLLLAGLMAGLYGLNACAPSKPEPVQPVKIADGERWTLKQALKDIGKDPEQLTRQELRSLVCAQCHVTYVIPKDKDGNSVGVFFPWQGSKADNISVENIIKVIRSNDAHLEWKQAVTGFKVGFMRHPEYEFYTYNSVHWKANVACADCHMPFTRVGSYKISDHNLMSPLKNGLKACQQCHTQTQEWLTSQVLAIQDRTVSQALLRQALIQAGVDVPADIPMELARYLNNRGVKKLPFKPELEFKDPFGIQDRITPAASYGK